mgnify:CR=1 FL=1
MTTVQDTIATLKGIPTKEELMEMLRKEWAIESKGFRSFRYDRVTKVEVVAYGNGTEDGANY